MTKVKSPAGTSRALQSPRSITLSTEQRLEITRTYLVCNLGLCRLAVDGDSYHLEAMGTSIIVLHWTSTSGYTAVASTVELTHELRATIWLDVRVRNDQKGWSTYKIARTIDSSTGTPGTIVQ